MPDADDRLEALRRELVERVETAENNLNEDISDLKNQIRSLKWMYGATIALFALIVALLGLIVAILMGVV